MAREVKNLWGFPTEPYGDPVLRIANNGRAGWVQDPGTALGLYQKGPSGYLANLYGGLQTGGASFAAVFVPAHEVKLPSFATAKWSWYQTNLETIGVNIVIWAHDPDDFDKRVEITQLASVNGLEHGAGWNAHEFDSTDAGMFYYGENVSGSGLTAGTQYTWFEFIKDALFSTWTIYRVSIESGWTVSGTIDDAWLADLELDGHVIILKPRDGEVIGRETKSFTKATASDSTADVTLVTPNATKRIQVLSLNMITTSATAADFECYFSVADAMPAAKVIAVRNLDTDAVNEHFVNFGDNGPKGEVGEVVSMRTSVNITTSGTYTIVYREV